MQRKRTALITGGAKGIGKAIAEKLASCGFSVAVNYKTSGEEARALIKNLQERGVNCVAVQADVSDFRAVEELYAYCRKCLGFVDTVVNNAGVSLLKPLYDCGAADFDYVMDANLRSVFNVCRVFSPDMVSEGFGRIVNIASVWGELGASTETVYSASKAGVIGFTKALNAELAPSGVIVNSVSPGLIATAMNAGLSAAELNDFTSGVSVGRAGAPSEIADVVELLTREATYIAGADIPVNGGLII